MNKLCRILALLAVSGATSAEAAQDTGLMLHNQRNAVLARSNGVQMSLNLKFGDRRSVRKSERLRLGVSAGPLLTLTDGSRLAARTMEFSISPGYQTSFRAGNHDLASRYTAAGLAEAKTRGIDGNPRLGVSTIGWVAIGLGAAAATYVALVVIATNCTGDCN